jgi:hypothetical protein
MNLIKTKKSNKTTKSISFNENIKIVDEDLEENSDDENYNQHINDEINLDDYTISEEDSEYKHYIDMMNIYLVYFKSLFKKKENATLFDGIEIEDDTSTNRALEMFYDEVNRYKICTDNKFKDLFELVEYKKIFQNIPNDVPLYQITIKDDTHEEHKRVTHNLITGILFISEFNWIKNEWNIFKLNSDYTD